jgi:hypothetical protein
VILVQKQKGKEHWRILKTKFCVALENLAT